MIPYARHFITEADVNAVSFVLRGDWLTTGPTIARFEAAFAERHKARYAVAMSSCTAALHAAVMFATTYSPVEFYVPALTFAATANAVIYAGATLNFVDVRRDNLAINMNYITHHGSVRPVCVTVEYAGLHIPNRQYEDDSMIVIYDKAHSCGNPHDGIISCYSFHPVKHITTGEGGMFTTDYREAADFARRFRNHGIAPNGDMIDLGYNYRMTDIQAALGLSQLATLDTRIARRRAIAEVYNSVFSQKPQIEIMPYPVDNSVWHLYPIRLNLDRLTIGRDGFRLDLARRGIGTQVHYCPVYRHPYYQRQLAHEYDQCPVAEAEYERLVSLPMWYGMTDDDVLKVIEVVLDVCDEYAR